jgi:hypothetical protein
MTRVRPLLVWLLCTALALGSCATAGSGAAPQGQRYAGRITSVTIEKCGLKPGTCEGSITVAPAHGGPAITLAITPWTRLTRGEQDVIIEDLSVGNAVTVEAEPRPGPLQLRRLYVF